SDLLLGPLSEFLDLPIDRAAGVESTLGSLLQVLVVQDVEAAERVRNWLAVRGDGDGAVALIPRSALPRVETLLETVLFAGEPADEPTLIGRRERLEVLRAQAQEADEVRRQRAQAREAASEAVAMAEA